MNNTIEKNGKILKESNPELAALKHIISSMSANVLQHDLTINQAQKSGETPAMKRYDSLDMFRGFSIMAMFLCHFTLYLSYWPEEIDWGTFIITYALDWVISASSFLTISGASNGISAKKAEILNTRNPWLYSIIRAVMLYLVATFLSFYYDFKEAMFDTDILFLMSVMTLIYPFARNFSDGALLTIIIIVSYATPIMRRASNFLEPWGNTVNPLEPMSTQMKLPLIQECNVSYLWPGTFSTVVSGQIFEGKFVLFPHGCFGLLGLIIGHQLGNGTFDSYMKVYAIVGTVLIIAGGLFSYIGAKKNLNPVTEFLSPLLYYPVSFSHYILEMGATIVELVLCHKYFDFEKIENWFFEAVRLTGQFSLSYYTYHYMIIFGITHIKEWIKGTDYEVNNIMEWYYCIPLAIVVWVVFSFALFPLIKKNKGIGSVEHLIGLVLNLAKKFEATENGEKGAIAL